MKDLENQIYLFYFRARSHESSNCHLIDHNVSHLQYAAQSVKWKLLILIVNVFVIVLVVCASGLSCTSLGLDLNGYPGRKPTVRTSPIKPM
jgi:hypothetical protein